MVRKKNNWPRILLLWILITSISPFIFYKWPFHPYKVLTFCCLLLMSFDLLLKKGRIKINKLYALIILIQITFISIYSFFFPSDRYLNIVIQLVSLQITLIYIKEFINFSFFAKQYIYLIALMGIGGTIIFFLHLFIGVNPIFSVDYSESGTSYFLGLTTTNVYYNWNELRFMRFSGFFDEPGAFALYSIFAILINKLYFKNFRIELTLIITTLFCFSLAFYAFLLFYFLLFYFTLNRFIYVFSAFFSLIILNIFLQNNLDSNPSSNINKIYQASFKRLEFNNDGFAEGQLEGSRPQRMKTDLKTFSKNIFFGAGTSNARGANLYSIPAAFGIIGTFFYYLVLIYLIYNLINLSNLFSEPNKIIFLILINLYHRPELLSFFASLILFLFIILNQKKTKLDRLTNSYTNT